MMNIEEFRDYCIRKKGVSEEFPFDNRTLVFKVMGKMFALTDVEEFESVNLKCDPELTLEYREKFAGVLPGYHMNKTHWNTVLIHSDVNDKLLKEWIDHSYSLVSSSLSKKLREELSEQ